MTVPEFSRITSLAEIGSTPRKHVLSADPAERAALATRFDLASLERLEAEAALAATEDGIEASGRVRADYVQTCVATGTSLERHLDERFRIRFVASVESDADETELSDEDCDLMAHDGLGIDLGEAVAQTLGLSIEPFPRAVDADAVLRAAGVIQAEDASPFARLKGLFDKS